MTRLLRLPLPAAIVVLALAGCTAVTAGAPRQTGEVPSGLDRFYAQQVAWGGCGGYATNEPDAEAFAAPGLQCARVDVPLDYASPDGATSSIALLRRPAEDPANRIGSLVINPGGPGASGMSSAASLAEAVAGTELGRRFDLVGFDPRGIGATEPAVKCQTTEEMDAERLDLDLDSSPAGVAQTEAEERAFAQLCAERVGLDVLATVGTRDVARDLDVLRAALGDEKLTFLGYSYGTRIGTEYAEQFPQNVRALVLDGALDPDETVVEGLINQGAGFQRSFDAFVDACLAQPDCWTSGPVAATEAQYQQILAPLQEAPLPVGDRLLSYDDAAIATIQALYSDKLWPILDRGLRALATGDGTVMLLLADLYYNRGPDGYAGNRSASIAVQCVDDPPITDPAVWLETDRRYREVAPFLDDGNPPSPARGTPCAFWPVPPTGEPGVPDVGDLAPVLVVSTTGDPATPYDAGVQLADALGARLLTFEGNQHTVALQDVPCVNDAVTAYLVDGTLPAEGTRCTR